MLYILSRQNININFKLNFFCDPCALIYIGVSSWKCMFFTLPLPPNTCMCNLNNCGDKGFYTAAMNFSYIFSFFFYLSFGCFVDYIFFSFPCFYWTYYLYIYSSLGYRFFSHTTKQLFLDYDKYDEFKSLSTYLNTNFYAIICIRVVRYILLMGEGN